MKENHLSKNQLRSLISRVPQPPGRRLGPVLSLLGTGPHSRSWAVGKRAKLHGPLPIAHITAWNIPPHPRKNCLPRNQSLMPKRLGATVIRTRNKLQCVKPLKFWGLWEHLASPKNRMALHILTFWHNGLEGNKKKKNIFPMPKNIKRFW